MQWDHAEQYPGAAPATHPNGAHRVTALTVAPRDADRFRTWTTGADVPLRLVTAQEPGLRSVTVETDGGEVVISR